MTRVLLLGVALGLAALLLLAVTALAGGLWNPDGVPICTAPDDQWSPASVPDGAGGAFITWYDDRGTDGSIYAQRVDSSGRTLWASDGVAIRGDLGSDVSDPAIADDGAGGAIITWDDDRSNTQVYAQRVNGQGVVQWTADGVQVAPTGTGQNRPHVVEDGAGGAIITWGDYRATPGVYAQRVNGAGASLWGATGVAVCTLGGSEQWTADITTDGAHGAILTWMDTRTGDFNVFAQRMNQAGAPLWAANGIAVCTAASEQMWPQIESDSSGGAIITWEDVRAADSDIYAQRVSSSGSRLWGDGGLPVCVAGGDQQDPQLTADGSGSPVLVWMDERSGNEIYAQKLLAGGTVAPGWAANGIPVAPSQEPQYIPVITGDGSGGAIISWSQGFFGFAQQVRIAAPVPSGFFPRVYTQQILSTGKVPAGWDPAGEPVTDVDEPQEWSAIVPDGTGGAIVCWEDYRTFDYWDIYAQRVKTTPATWYLAEGSSAWGFESYISIENPNESDVPARITYMTPTGPPVSRDVTLPALSQTTVDPLADIGYETDFSTKVESMDGHAIGVDRTMIWQGEGAPCTEAHSSVGVNSPNDIWYLPEGSSAWGFESWLLIQNPNENDATCTVTYMIEGAVPQVVTKTVPGDSRQSFNMADDIGQADASMQVVSDVPVIAERSMYRDNRREGSESIGTVQTSTDYFLAEGTTNYGFTAYVLVQNPNSSPCLVSLTYMTPAGPQSQAPFSMPAFSRTTIRVNDALPASDFSTQVHSDLPVIAERSMYWGAGTEQGEAVHDSIGVAQPQAIWYIPDGQSSEGRETYTLVQNPNATPVVVEVSYLVAGGGSGNVTFQDTIPAQSRQTYSLADRIPSDRAAIVVTCLTDGSKVICERAMYWNGRGAGTCTIGGSAD
ncbi:MAG: hypothetical protein KKF41_02595 [Actinobacteria bacterium]|nr:hypothetical protein [Actinomycetota bacterium]MBU1943527.1 hypothetical protein [Actinomycetota bacterium]MBU2686456.1 hypothetical protein [Actinomycetota bacterium]